MRLVAAALLLALGAVAGATAQVPLPPLAAGEVALKTIGLGQVSTPADRALVRTMVGASGEDDAGAGRALRARLDRIDAALRAAGIQTADIAIGEATINRDNSRAGSSRALAALLEQGRAPSARFGTGWPATSATVPLVITVRDMTKLAAVRQVLSTNNLAGIPPEYFLANDRAQRWQAREQAVRRARADAETQAALLNMRVARIVRISDRTYADAPGLAVNEAPTVIRQLNFMLRAQSSEVETMVAVGVDFALAPR